MTTLSSRAPAVVAPPQLDAVDHLELWVGNARQTAEFFASVLGFDVMAYAGPETWRPDRASYVLEQGGVRIIVTGALHPESDIAAHVCAHGDGVRDIAFTVPDARAAFSAAVERGATAAWDPWLEQDQQGALTRATIATYGDTVHTLVERDHYDGAHAPRYEPVDLVRPAGSPVGLEAFDHIVANVEEGALTRWVDWYRDVLGLDELTRFDEAQISTEYSALRSTVMWNHGQVVLPINEPAPGRRTSQIQEYLDFYRSPGVQHIALRTADIVSTVRALRTRGLRFLDVPPSYYDEARQRLTGVDLPWDALSELGILVDRPTLFLEIIQREGARGFGEGNFKALFEAIEREQERRGNL